MPDDVVLKAGQRIAVRTPDRREYRGEFVELRTRDNRTVAVVKLDTGWVTTFPPDMIHPLDE